tara:strand:- start:383 stop:1174 length:792 start_codon:yes stop_codon:yes gene_type:complete
MHFYEISINGPVFRADVVTPPQARKLVESGVWIVASVTTKLSIAPNPYLTKWSRQEAARLARQHPDLSIEEVVERVYGMREHPETGEEILSAKFGTLVHKELEDALNLLKFKKQWSNKPYEKFVKPFLEWFRIHQFNVVSCESIVAGYNTAGMVDLIAEDTNGRVCLFDYKTRQVAPGGDIKKKSYPSDCMQLAIEAEMVRDKMKLSYRPDVYTVIIDSNSGETYTKRWTDTAAAKAVIEAKLYISHYDDIYRLHAPDLKPLH